MELNVITMFEGEVYKVGTGTSAVTIPVRTKKTYGIKNGDVLGIAIFKQISKKDIAFNKMVERVIEDNKPENIINEIPLEDKRKFKVS